MEGMLKLVVNLVVKEWGERVLFELVVEDKVAIVVEKVLIIELVIEKLWEVYNLIW